MPKLVSALLACAVALAAAAAPAAAAPKPRPVLFVGNNWDGTASVVDPTTFRVIHRLNIVPDKQERLGEIAMNPQRQGYFLAIRQLVGEGHDQFVDDMFSSHDGRFLYVSRPSFADVVAIDLATEKIVWRQPVEGQRSDHMAISPDGTTLLVSASTAAKVHAIDTRTGRIAGSFPSGETPHENNYSRDGKLVFHASIGKVYTPTDDPSMDATKGERVFEIVDAKSLKVLKRLDMGKKLAEAGYPNMSSAVRPMAISPDEKWLYFQVSFFHGFVEYDLARDRVTRLAHLPVSEEAKSKRRDEYLLDSAHHGLAINGAGTKLCAAGTMSDYAAIVRRNDFHVTIAARGAKPYWSTNSADGRLCYISFSGDDAVGVVSYASERQIARFAVGDHPQRMRTGFYAVAALRQATGGSSTAKRRPKLRVRVRPKRVRARTPGTTVRARVTVRRNGELRRVRRARVYSGGVQARTNRRGVAVLRKRRGFMRVHTYRVTAVKKGYRPGHARIRATRR